MRIFIEAVLVLAVLIYLYRLIFGKASNPLGIPRVIAIVLLIVGFFALPPPIQAFVIAVIFIALIVKMISRTMSKNNQ